MSLPVQFLSLLSHSGLARFISGSIPEPRGYFMDKTTRKLIAQLKTVKSEKKLSPQDIVDICEENGEPVSLSTVKRVFSPDCESMNFRYDATIRPIAKAVLGLSDEFDPDEEEAESTQAEHDALRALVDLKNHFIEQLESGIRDREATIQKTREAADATIALKDRIISHLKDEVADLRKEREEMAARLKAAERGSRLRTIALAIVIPLLIIALIVVIYFAWDLSHSDRGFFQWTASFFGASARGISI